MKIIVVHGTTKLLYACSHDFFLLALNKIKINLTLGYAVNSVLRSKVIRYASFEDICISSILH